MDKKWKRETPPWNKNKGCLLAGCLEYFEAGRTHITRVQSLGEHPCCCRSDAHKPQHWGLCPARRSLDPDRKSRLPGGLSCAFSCRELDISVAKPQWKPAHMCSAGLSPVKLPAGCGNVSQAALGSSLRTVGLWLLWHRSWFGFFFVPKPAYLRTWFCSKLAPALRSFKAFSTGCTGVCDTCKSRLKKGIRALAFLREVLLPALQCARWLLNKAADFTLGEHLAQELLSSGPSSAEVKNPTVSFFPSLRCPYAFGQWLHIREDLVLKKICWVLWWGLKQETPISFFLVNQWGSPETRWVKEML